MAQVHSEFVIAANPS